MLIFPKPRGFGTLFFATKTQGGLALAPHASRTERVRSAVLNRSQQKHGGKAMRLQNSLKQLPPQQDHRPLLA